MAWLTEEQARPIDRRGRASFDPIAVDVRQESRVDPSLAREVASLCGDVDVDNQHEDVARRLVAP